MQSQFQMIESIISKTVRQKISDLAQPGRVMNLINQELNSIMTRVLDDALKAQQTEMLERQPYQRKDSTIARNGYKCVSVPGLAGQMILHKPVVRKGTLKYPLLSAIKNAGKGFIDVLAGCFWLKGASTRNTADILKNAFGVRMSAQSISQITNHLEPAIKEWESQPIPADIIYLFLDALFLPVRWHAFEQQVGFVQKNALLAGLGVNAQGKTRVLGFLLGDRENLDTWESFLEDLKKRGLNPAQIKLVISDEHKAIVSAVAKSLGTPHQYCVFHKLRNIRYRLAAPDRKAFLADFKAIYWAKSKADALQASGILQGRWGKRYPKAVELTLANFENFTMFMNEPPERWRVLRTSNRIERFNEELRRRLKPAGTIHSELELRKICWSVSQQQDASWLRRCAFKADGKIMKEEVA